MPSFAVRFKGFLSLLEISAKEKATNTDRLFHIL